MEIEPILLKALLVLNYGNGALLIVASATAGALLISRVRNSPPALPIGAVTRAAFFLFYGLALMFAFYPNYSDHVGPAMTGLGTTLLAGRPLYPGLEDYSFHGVLYGPLPAEIQAAAIFVGTTLAGLPVMLSSKLSGVLIFLAACAVFFRLSPGWGFGRAYFILFLLPFHIYAFWNRSEPVFLLLVACSFWAVASCPPRRALLVLGICAGLASGAKLHGALYIAPAVAVYFARERITAGAMLTLAAAAAGAFLLLFSPGNVSLAAFLDYLLLGVGQGLSRHAFLLNLVFIGALWSPLVVALAADGRWRELRSPTLLALGALQVLVAIVGSKPGAGIHHLLPFIPANALVFAVSIDAGAQSEPGAGRRLASNLVWVAALLPGLAVCPMLYWGMAKNWRTFDLAGKELAQIQARYPDAVMGLAGLHTYAYTLLRPMLQQTAGPQVEYSSYMDLQLVGVPDTPLREAFESCQIRHLAVPRGEPPFSMKTYYWLGTPLFSDELRETFQRRFVRLASGNWYDVYECKRS